MKKICSVLFLVLFGVCVFASLVDGYDQFSQEVDNLSDWRTADEIETEAAIDAASSHDTAGPSKITGSEIIKAVAQGLVDAGLLLDEVVENLQGQGNSISEISIAILPLCDNDVDVARTAMEVIYTTEEINAVLPLATSAELVTTEAAFSIDTEAGQTVSDCVDDLLSRGYTTTEIAKIFNEGDVSIENAFSALVTSSEMGEVVNNLISAGYKKEEVYDYVVTEMKNSGSNAREIADAFRSIVLVNPEYSEEQHEVTEKDGETYYETVTVQVVSAEASVKKTKENSVDLVKALNKAGFDGGEIVAAVGSFFDDLSSSIAVDLIKDSGMSIKESFAALSEVSSDVAARVTSMIEGGFKAEDVYDAAVLSLKTEGKTNTEIISILQPTFKDKTADGAVVAKTLMVEDYLSNNGLQSCVMFLIKNNTFSQNLYETLEAKGYSKALIKETIKNSMDEIIADMKSEGKSAQDIVRHFKSNRGVDYTAELTSQMINAGFSRTEVIGNLASLGGSQTEIMQGLRNVAVSDANSNEVVASAVTQNNYIKSISSIINESGCL